MELSNFEIEENYIGKKGETHKRKTRKRTCPQKLCSLFGCGQYIIRSGPLTL